ncbi:HlyD family secretion protein [Stappia indica]|uniref:HlyD family secretion protein n=1 Tax=Stappia indica TaxID=538381 RepID=UPI00083798AA|nr:HlyD family efflux transporter periplasmic adaptor subunit [Stappia indica]
MRPTRLIIGFLIIAMAVFVIAGEQLAGVSADAAINARVTTLRTPISGTLRLDRRSLGASVAEGEALGAIEDPLVDSIRLNDLLREEAFTKAEIAHLRQTIAAIEASLERLQLRAENYREDRVRQLETELRSAQSQIAVAQARVEEAQAAFDRSQQLSERGVETSASFERIRAAQRVSQQELESARQKATSVEIALSSARRGTFLGDGYSDVPYSEQRQLELTLRLNELSSDLQAELARAEALERRTAAERLRVHRLTSAELTANVSGRIWEVLASDGETVQRGQDIMRLIDCDSSIVTLSVSESVYNGLQLGDPAMFRVNADGRAFEGSVTRLAGSGAETIYRNLAIAPSERHLERYDVTLLLPALRSDPELGCAVGRTGRAFFEARPLDFLRRFWD